MKKYKMFIDGEWVAASTGSTFLVRNPATSEILGSVPNVCNADTQNSIEAADKAFKLWSKSTANVRSELLKKWFELIVSEKKEIAKIMTSEQGKPLQEAEAEVMYAASFVE